MLVVVDTNILVAGHINPRGAPALIVDLLDAGAIRAIFTDAILDEYDRVLSMPEFGFDYDGQVRPFLDQLEADGVHLNTPALNLRLTDESDEPFLAAAIIGRASYLITSNIKHFPPDLRQGVRVILPRRFCARYMPGY